MRLCKIWKGGTKDMLIKEITEMVHENAVQHGWWEEPRKLATTVALIHSEWSEALEEARAGRPLIYKLWIGDENEEPRIVTPETEEYAACGMKPEGVAVELMDGVIRIFDLFGAMGYEVEDPDSGESATLESIYFPDDQEAQELVPEDAGELVTSLHLATSDFIREDDPQNLLIAAGMAMIWIRKHGIDPLKVLMEKHEYNKGRPYKHGKKF